MLGFTTNINISEQIVVLGMVRKEICMTFVAIFSFYGKVIST